MSAASRRFLRLGSIYAVGMMAVNGVGLLMVPLYTAFLSPADYGAIALLAVTSALLTQGISTVGFHALTRFYYAPEYEDRRGVLLFNLLIATVLGSAVVALLYYAAASRLSTLLLGDASRLPLVRLYGLVVLLTSPADFCRAFLRLRERAGVAVGLGLAGVTAAAAVALLLLLRFDAGVHAMAAAAVASQVVFLAGGLLVLLPQVTPRLSWAALLAPLRYGAPLAFSGYANLLMHTGDRYLLRLLAPLSEVGIYSFGYRFGEVFNQALVEPFYFASQPAIMQAEHDRSEQCRLLNEQIRAYVVWVSGAALAAALFADEFVRLLARQPAFHAAANVVAIAILGYLFYGLGSLLSYTLVMAKQSARLTALYVGSAALNVALNVALIPGYGAMGAALATLVTYALWGLSLTLFSRSSGVRVFRTRVCAFPALAVGLWLMSLEASKLELPQYLPEATMLIAFVSAGWLALRHFARQDALLLQPITEATAADE